MEEWYQLQSNIVDLGVKRRRTSEDHVDSAMAETLAAPVAAALTVRMGDDQGRCEMVGTKSEYANVKKRDARADSIVGPNKRRASAFCIVTEPMKCSGDRGVCTETMMCCCHMKVLACNAALEICVLVRPDVLEVTEERPCLDWIKILGTKHQLSPRYRIVAPLGPFLEAVMADPFCKQGKGEFPTKIKRMKLEDM